MPKGITNECVNERHKEGRKKKLGTYPMNRVAAGAHVLTFENCRFELHPFLFYNLTYSSSFNLIFPNLPTFFLLI